jgi:hypothetical protein
MEADDGIIPCPLFKLENPHGREFIGKLLEMFKGADEFTGSAAGAFFAVGKQDIGNDFPMGCPGGQS